MGDPVLRPWEFPVLRQRVRLALAGGDVDVDGATLGGLAVTPSTRTLADTGGSFFQVTHVASGKLIGAAFGFESEAAAIGAMRALVATPVDWRAASPDLPDGFRYVVTMLFALWGAFEGEDVFDDVEGHA